MEERLIIKSNGQWELEEESLEKAIGKRLAGLAVAGATMMGGQAKADAGHLSNYLNKLHGMELGGHKVEVHHEDQTPKEFTSDPGVGKGKFKIKLGDYVMHGSYKGVGSDNIQYKLSTPTHHKDGHGPFEGGWSTKGDQHADELHRILHKDPELGIKAKLQQKRK